MKLLKLLLGASLVCCVTGCVASNQTIKSQDNAEITGQSEANGNDEQEEITKNTEEEKQEEQLTDKQQQSIDTLYWMNGTYGIIIQNNGLDINYLGGFLSQDTDIINALKGALARDWGIESKQDAEETVSWLLADGHNASLLSAYEEMNFDNYSREEISALSCGNSPEENLCIYDAAKTYGENAIAAWDWARAIEVLTWSYKAGYYTYDEAMNKNLEIAKKLQETYTSWDDMMGSFILGCQYWLEDDLSDPDSESYRRWQLYEELKQEEENPYTLEWNIPLDRLCLRRTSRSIKIARKYNDMNVLSGGKRNGLWDELGEYESSRTKSKI